METFERPGLVPWSAPTAHRRCLRKHSAHHLPRGRPKAIQSQSTVGCITLPNKQEQSADTTRLLVGRGSARGLGGAHLQKHPPTVRALAVDSLWGCVFPSRCSAVDCVQVTDKVGPFGENPVYFGGDVGDGAVSLIHGNPVPELSPLHPPADALVHCNRPPSPPQK